MLYLTSPRKDLCQLAVCQVRGEILHVNRGRVHFLLPKRVFRRERHTSLHVGLGLAQLEHLRHGDGLLEQVQALLLLRDGG